MDCVGLCLCVDGRTSAVVSGDTSSSCTFLVFFVRVLFGMLETNVLHFTEIK